MNRLSCTALCRLANLRLVLLLVAGFSAQPAASQNNMGGNDYDASAYNLNAQLLAAAKRGDAERALGLLQRGAVVNARNRNGETPLMLFVKKELDAIG